MNSICFKWGMIIEHLCMTSDLYVDSQLASHNIMLLCTQPVLKCQS